MITYTVGGYGMDDGGSLLIAQRDMTDAGPLQTGDPKGPGYVTASTSGEARVEVDYDPWRWIRPWRGALVIKACDGSLTPGDLVRVVLGDMEQGSPGWSLQSFPETGHEFKVLVDPFGTRKYRPLSENPTICIEPGEAVELDAITPSLARPEEEIPVRIRALDRFGNPLRDFEGEVEADSCPSAFPSRTFKLEPGDTLAGKVKFEKEGDFTLQIRCKGLLGCSNPIRVYEGPELLWWADLHGQTEDTIGTGTLEEYFRYAQDRALVDVTSWQGNDLQVTPRIWEEVCDKTRIFNQPGSFVTFLGYEWSGLTPSGGDHNILFLKDDQEIRRSSLWQVEDAECEREFCPISELWTQFRNREDVMAISHVGGRYTNLDFWDPEICGLVEIHSNHGTFEWLAKEALRKGLVIGIVAGSDDHSGRPGWSPPVRRGGVRGTVRLDLFGGLTAIYASSLEREKIWQALKSRHCYATTGERIVLDVKSGNYMMGDIVEGKVPVEVSAGILGTSPLLDVEVLRDDEVIYRYPFSDDSSNQWVRIHWSGLRVRSRNKRARWEGRIRVTGGRIVDMVRLGFQREGDIVSKVSDNEICFETTTAGDPVGAFLKLAGQSPRLSFESEQITKEVGVKELQEGPRKFGAGGLNMELAISLSSPRNRPDSVEFWYRDPTPPSGTHGYWIRVLQIDGHGAWSSPIYFKR